MDPNSGEDEPSSWDDLCKINLVPSQLFLKFRKQLDDFRLGVNFEFYNAPVNDFHGKVVLKPLSHKQRWKFICQPLDRDVHVLSKKIPVTKFFNLQVGIGYNFGWNSIGWSWKLTTCFGGDGISKIENKTSIGLYDGVDLRFRWRADYVLPEIAGGLGTGEPLVTMKSGQLRASLDRIEAIFTHKDEMKTPTHNHDEQREEK